MLRRPGIARIIALVAAVGCGDDGAGGQGATTNGGGGSGANGGEGPQGGDGGTGGPDCSACEATCADSAPSECHVASCSATCECVIGFAELGVPTRDQVPGDCGTSVCDGAGETTTLPDDEDLPDDDGNLCTGETCENGDPLHPPEPLGTPCEGDSTCDGAGNCPVCLGDLDCGDPDECATPQCLEDGTCDADVVPANTPVGAQIDGNCSERVCNGTGSVTMIADPDDLPDDDNPCTDDTCNGGSPLFTPLPATPCGVGGMCNAQGQCEGCVNDSDCPGQDTFCRVRDCDAGICGFVNTANGTDLPAASQTPGNCTLLECQAGVAQPVADPNDPFVDGNECTSDLCVGTTPDNPDESPGEPCSVGGSICDGNGACVDCINDNDCDPPVGFPCVTATCTAQGDCGTMDANANTVCGAASCTNGVAQATDLCNGSGDCIDGASTSCSPYVCGPVACTDSCIDNNGCAPGFICDTGIGECTNGPTCTQYCNNIMANCTGGSLQYFSLAACLSSCKAFPRGTAADLAGDTVGCRTYHASVANNDVHCYHAGPGGAGQCGTDCTGFCDIALDACTGPNQQYGSTAACMTECAGFPTSPPYTAAVQSGDSFACRMYHLTAATQQPGLHCPHIIETSGPCQ